MNDPNDSYLWKLYNGSKILAQVLECVPCIKRHKVVHQALNGAMYVHQIGTGPRQLDLTVFVDSQEDLLSIDQCNADGKFLRVYYRGVSYFGVIEDEMPEWEAQELGKNYTGRMTFLVTNAIKDVIT